MSKILFPSSIETEPIFTSANADPSIDWTLCEIIIDSGDENENAHDSIRVNLESDSKIIDRRD
jgi:hypothetical protein